MNARLVGGLLALVLAVVGCSSDGTGNDAGRAGNGGAGPGGGGGTSQSGSAGHGGSGTSPTAGSTGTPGGAGGSTQTSGSGGGGRAGTIGTGGASGSSDTSTGGSGQGGSSGGGGGTGGAGGTTGSTGGTGGTSNVYDDPYVSTASADGAFPLVANGAAAPLVINAADFAGVTRAAKALQTDIGNVTQVKPTLATDTIPSGAKQVVLIGTVGKSDLLDQLVKAGKLDVSSISGKWETFLIQAVSQPTSGVDSALVIAGSDKRGTIYGIYDLSKHIGVSPWYWWADVPIAQKSALYILPGKHTQGPPAVKYRGFFINDESPALSGMVDEKFGGFKSGFYEKVFELLLRLKANYLWPAMWGRAFNTDDPKSPVLADEYGIVMGTSHQEAMMRSQQEWDSSNLGDWDYSKNATAIKNFWTQGIKNMGTHESYVTVGMRGENDTAMSSQTNITLLEQIISDQRSILKTVTGKEPATIPQVLTVYKEIQDYMDQGLQVPTDVTIMYSDDNWGNVRRLPAAGDTSRQGGYGMYYHYDYVGSPRSYRWLNTNPIARAWEQMHLAYNYGVKQIWIVNVGDIKPMEFPIEFFMDYAWNPDLWPAESLSDYTRLWAGRQFGDANAATVGDILTKYTKYNGRRKPELLDPNTYSVTNYREAETVVSDYNALVTAAQKINDSLPTNAQDAFFELVLWPVKACANLNELYVSAAKNALYASQGRASANDLATKVTSLFSNDASLSKAYNQIAGGKWNHMADQTHIGYTSWDAPSTNAAPTTKQVTLASSASMGVAIEGSTSWWPNSSGSATLGEFTPYDSQTSRYIEVFNRGQGSFDFTATSTASYLKISPASGSVSKDQRLEVSVDWASAPTGANKVPITISGPGSSSVTVQASLNNPASPAAADVKGFVESNGFVSMEAEHYSKAVGGTGITWQRIPDLGRTLSGVTAFPVTASKQTAGGTGPHLEYNVFLFKSGSVQVTAYVSPTLNFTNKGLSYALSLDDGTPQAVSITSKLTSEDSNDSSWMSEVSVNIFTAKSTFTVSAAGAHVLKFWMVEPGVVLQKLVLETSGAQTCYLGAPESLQR